MVKLANQFTIFDELGEFLKRETTPIEWITKSLAIIDDNGVEIGQLAPVNRNLVQDSSIVKLFSKWRDDHQYAYPSRFSVTVEGTSTWLKSAVIENDARILFVVLNASLLPVGHLGVLRTSSNNFTLEVDNVLRGVAKDTPGLMKYAMQALESWAELEFTIDQIELRVLESNTHAVSFYTALGYQEVSREALVWSGNESSKTLVPGTNPDEFLVTMVKQLGAKDQIPDLILTAGPSIGSQERSNAYAAAAYGWNAKHSDYLSAFERAFAEYVGADFAMATSSCTGALHLALLAAGIGPGAEVIVPEITWVATASAIRYVGAKPVFADVDEQTWTIDIDSARKLVTDKTRAIMPVHLYGFPADMVAVNGLASEFGLSVIEDAAPAIGATIGSQCVGTFGDIGCFSFQGAKMLVTGEGGMLVTDNPELAERARKFQEHGRKPGTFWIEELGYKYKMANVQAAIGLGQLSRSDNQIHRKRRIHDWYVEGLKGVNEIQFQEERHGTKSIDWMTSIYVPGWSESERDRFMSFLRGEGVDSRPVFPPMSQFPIWGYEVAPQPVAERIGAASINLPSGVRLSRSEVDKVSSAVRKYFGA